MLYIASFTILFWYLERDKVFGRLSIVHVVNVLMYSIKIPVMFVSCNHGRMHRSMSTVNRWWPLTDLDRSLIYAPGVSLIGLDILGFLVFCSHDYFDSGVWCTCPFIWRLQDGSGDCIQYIPPHIYVSCDIALILPQVVYVVLGIVFSLFVISTITDVFIKSDLTPLLHLADCVNAWRPGSDWFVATFIGIEKWSEEKSELLKLSPLHPRVSNTIHYYTATVQVYVLALSWFVTIMQILLGYSMCRGWGWNSPDSDSFGFMQVLAISLLMFGIVFIGVMYGLFWEKWCFLPTL